MPLPQIRISTWRNNAEKQNSPFVELSDEQLANDLYDVYKDKRWLEPTFIAEEVKRGDIMKDKKGNPILNVYSGDVSREDWVEEFLLAEHEFSEGKLKDTARFGAKVVHGFGQIVPELLRHRGVLEDENTEDFIAKGMHVSSMEDDSLTSELIRRDLVRGQEEKPWTPDPKEEAAREEQYQYMLSNILGFGKYLGLPDPGNKPINALQQVELELAEKIRDSQLADPKQIQKIRKDLIEGRFGHVSDKLLRSWALTEVERQDMEKIRNVDAGGATYRQQVMRPGGMGIEGWKKAPALGTLAFLGGDLGPFILGMNKVTKGIESAVTSLMSGKGGKVPTMINKVLDKLPEWKYWDKSWILAKTTLDKSKGQRIPIDRVINLRDIVTSAPKLALSAEITSQVVFDPYEERLSKIMAEQIYQNDEDAAGFFANLWNPDDDQLTARSKMALENVMILPAGYAVAKTAFGVLGRILRGPKDKLAMFMERLGTDVETVHVGASRNAVDLQPEKLSTLREKLQFSPHSWIRGPFNYLVLSFNKTGRQTPEMFALQQEAKGVEKATTTKVEKIANRIYRNVLDIGRRTVWDTIDELPLPTGTQKVGQAFLKLSNLKNADREADFIKVLKLITSDFDPTKGETYEKLAKELGPKLVRDITETRKMIDALTVEMLNSSRLTEAGLRAKLKEDLGKYLKVAYKLYDSPGYTPSQHQQLEFRDYFVKELGWSKPMAENHIKEIIEKAHSRVDNFLEIAANGARLKNTIFEKRKFRKIRYDDNANPIIEKGSKVLQAGKEGLQNVGTVTKVSKGIKEYKVTDKTGLNIPRWFFSSKPKYGYQDHNYNLQFESEVDKALYIVANPKKLSAKDGEYISWLKKIYNKFDPTKQKKETEQISLFKSRKAGPITTTELRKLGREVRQKIKALAVSAKGEVDTLVVPKHTIIKPEIRKSSTKVAAEGARGKDTATVKFKNPKTKKTTRREFELKDLRYFEDVKFEKAYKKFLGEIYDPRYNFVNTVQKMVHWVETSKLLDNYYAIGKGKYIFDTLEEGIEASAKTGLRIKGLPYKIVNRNMYPNQFNAKIGEGYGALSGKYTTGILKREVENVMNFQKSGAQRWFNNFLGAKALVNMSKTVWNDITHLRNFFSGPSFLLANGVAPFLTNPDAFAKSVRVIASQLKNAWDKDPSKFEDYYAMLQRRGVINTSTNANEAKALLSEFSDSTTANIFNKMERVGEKFGFNPIKPVKSLHKGVQQLYFAEDDFWKIMYFEHEKSWMTKNMSKIYTAEQIEDRAAQIVKDTMPNYEYVPPGLRRFLRRSPIGNFFSFRAEQIRTTFHIFNYGFREMIQGGALALRGEKMAGAKLALRGTRRVAGGTVITGMGSTAYSEASKKIFGITEAETKADQELIPYLEDPYYGVSEKGEPVVISLKSNDPYNIINDVLRRAHHEHYLGRMTGEDLNDVRMRIFWGSIRETFRPFYEEAIITDAIMTVITVEKDGKDADGRIVFQYTGVDDTVWNHTNEILAYLFFEKLAPGVVLNANRIYRAANGLKGRKGEEWDLETELVANTKSVRKNKMNLDTYQSGFKTKLSEHTKYQKSNFSSLFQRIGRIQDETVDGRDATTTEVLEALRIFNEAKLGTDIRVAYLVNAAYIRDLPEEFIEEQLQKKGYNKTEIESFKGYDFGRERIDQGRFVYMNMHTSEFNQDLWDTLQQGELREHLYDKIAELYPLENRIVMMDNIERRIIPTEVMTAIDNMLRDNFADIPLWTPEQAEILERERERQALFWTEPERDLEFKRDKNRRERITEAGKAILPFHRLVKKVKKRRDRREGKFEGGAISEDYPVSNVKNNPSERVDGYTGMPYEAEMERLGFAVGGDTKLIENEKITDTYFKDNPNDLEDLRKLLNYTPPPEQEKKPTEWNDVKTYIKDNFGVDDLKRAVQQFPYLLAAAPEDLGRLAALPYDIASQHMPLPNIGAKERLESPYAFQRFTDWASDPEKKGLFTEKALMPTIDKPQHTLGELFYSFIIDPTIAGPMLGATLAKAPLIIGMTKGSKPTKIGDIQATYRATKTPDVDDIGFYSQAEKNLVNLPEDQSHLKGQQLLAWVYGRNRNQKNDGVGIFAVTGEEKRILDLEQRVKKNTTPEELIELIQDRKLRLRHRVLRGQQDFDMSFTESMHTVDPLDDSYDYSKMYAEDILDEFNSIIEFDANYIPMWRAIARRNAGMETAGMETGREVAERADAVRFDKSRYAEDIRIIMRNQDRGSERWLEFDQWLKNQMGIRDGQSSRTATDVERVYEEVTLANELVPSEQSIFVDIFDKYVINATPRERTRMAEAISESRYKDNPYVKISIAGEVPLDTINVSFIKDNFPARYRELQLENRETIDLSELDIYAFGNEDVGWTLIDENEIYRPRSYGQEQPDVLIVGRSPAIMYSFEGSRAEAEVQLQTYMREGSQYELGWHETGEMVIDTARLHGQISLPDGKNYRETPIDILNPEILPEHVMRGKTPSAGHWEHWETPNIVTVTTTDRTLNTSKTVKEGKQSALHMEEVQSQAHQAGADPTTGYFDLEQAKIGDELEEAFELASEELAIAREEGLSEATIQRLQEAETQADLDWYNFKNEEMGVRDLPLKKDRYISMFIKKNIMQAIREGKDYVTLANPATIMERWNKQVQVADGIGVKRYHGGGTDEVMGPLSSRERAAMSEDGSGYQVYYTGSREFPSIEGRTSSNWTGLKMYKDLDELKANIKTDFPRLTEEQYQLVINTKDKPFTETHYADTKITGKPTETEVLESKEFGGYTYFTFDIKGEPHVTGRGKMHYVLYKHSIPRVANKVVRKLDKNARTSYEKFDYLGESGINSSSLTSEEVFTIPITEQMKKTLEAQGGISPFGYAQGGLVKALQVRVAKRNGGQMRNYKKEYANYQSRPEQKKNRAKRNAARRSLLRSGRVQKGDGKDVDHKDGNPQNNSPNNLLVKSKSNNRSFSRKGYLDGGPISLIEVLGRRKGQFILEEDIVSSDAFATHNEEAFQNAIKEGINRREAVNLSRDKGLPARLKETSMKDLIEAQKEYGKPIYLADSTVGKDYKIERQNLYYRNLKDYKRQGYYNDPEGNKITSQPPYQRGADSYHVEGQAIDLNQPYYRDYNRKELAELIPILGKYGFVQDDKEEWHFSQGEQSKRNIFR